MEPVTEPVDLSIIIVNYRGWKSLEECLVSIAGLSNVPFSVETIVVDNCSDDGKLLDFQNHFSQFRFILNSGNHGFAHGCNTGAAHAFGKFLLFLNPDTVISSSSLESMMQSAYQAGQQTLISCAQFDSRGKDMKPFGFFLSPLTLFGIPRAIYRKIKGTLQERDFAGHKVLSPEWVSGSVILISAGFFKFLGGWEEAYWMYYEDMDLSLRVRRAGGEILFLSDVKLRHDHGGASRLNVATRALTKSEVMVSRHVYIQRNIGGWKGAAMHMLLVLTNLFTFPLLSALLGIIFFFLKPLKIHVVLYAHLLRYYFNALLSLTWISRRSVCHRRM